jgi:D-sedoheptulose 7-phosphate isomerase|tara:strand:+ start:2251 stop:2820 length:570 start_codon:yes stop_codon:yes gene_type:complete
MKHFFKKSGTLITGLDQYKNLLSKIGQDLLLLRKRGGKIAIIGNGGSQSMAEHFSTELNCTFVNKNRKPFKALTFSNQASLTAWSNDFDFQTYYKRMVECYLTKNDLLLILSTSGGSLKSKKSINLVNAAKISIKKKIKIYSFLGNDGGSLLKILNKKNCVVINSKETSKIQECHLAMIHYICTLIDAS